MATFIIVCGGTGGHLSPGIAMAQRLEARGHACELVLSRKEIDSRLCSKYPSLTFVRAPGIAFTLHPLKLPRILAEAIWAVVHAIRHLHAAKPVAVIAFGGFVTPAYGLMAALLQIPIILHEANRKPGKAIRMLSRFADRLYLPEGVMLRTVRPRVVRHFGFPLRQEIRHIPKNLARKKLGLPLRAKILVVFGGSQGALSFNEWVQQHMDSLVADGISVYSITGPGKGTEGVLTYASDAGDSVNVWFRPFVDQIAEVLSSADLVVSRAGAGSIAEIIACLAPSIIIPYPYAADNHQEENARFLERQGGCVVLEQKNLDNLYREICDVIFNDWMLQRLRDNMRALNRGEWAESITDDIERLLRSREQQERLATQRRV